MTSPAAYGGGDYILDNSAWVRIHREAGLQAEWAAAVRAGQLCTCAITKLEILHSARTTTQYEEWREALDALRDVPVTRAVCNAAVAAMTKLAGRSDGNHRVSLSDYLIGAAAQSAGVGVLHQDRHFDKLAEVLGFESRWLDPTRSIA